MALAVETACRRHEGQPLAAISDGLVAAYLDTKTRQIKASRALYACASDLDTSDLIGGISRRLGEAISMLLASAADATFADLASVTFAFRAMLAGTVRSVLEPGATPSTLAQLRAELPVMCRAYLLAAARREV